MILAHRPFWSGPAHYEACVSAAQSIEKLLLLIERTFGFDNITYLMAYCVYTGASALLRDAKSGNADAAAKVQTFTRALRTGAKKCPLLERSLDIIKKGLVKPSPAQNTPPDAPQSLVNPPTTIHGFIPAFPYSNCTAPGGYDVTADLVGTTAAGFSMLDCFPEAHMDFGDWYTTSM